MGLRLKSERQIQAEILARLIAQLGINDVNPGSVADVLTQAVAQQDFALYYQIAQVSRLVDIDSLTGDDLDAKSFEYGLERVQPEKAKGTITIFRAAGFQKVSTTFYAGSPSPIVGDTIIDVNDASNVLISTSGTLILGRGTNNEEEASYSASPINNTTYWRFTLDLPLTKDHAVEETVILKQGNDEIVSAGTTVIVPPTGVSSEIQFQTDNDVTLLAGEDRIENVEITASEPGTGGNISVGAIDGTAAFPTAPFAGARAKNETKITTGIDLETDDELRDRIKNYIQGVTRAVKQAIYNAIVGLVDPETAKRVVSANIVLPIDVAGDVKVYIDDGQGFEPSFLSQGFETVLSQSTGGQQRLQVDRFPVVKAQIETNSAEPFNMSSGTLVINYQVGNISETVQFQPADFRFPEIATSEEIVAIINNRSTLIEARTSEIGKYILITAKADTNENIQVTGGNANSILNFPTDEKTTINLYIDDIKMNKDGQTALVDSRNSSPYNLDGIGPYPHTLTLIVDGKSANPQTATIQLADVANTAAVTVAEICAVLNRDISGIEAVGIENNTKVRIISLTKLKASSKLQVTGGSLNNSINGLNFATSQVIGADNDYKFNRELGIIELTKPLVANQSVTIGSQFTRAKFIAANAELYSPGNGQTLVIQVDGGADQTITFDGTFAAGKTAQQTVNFINATLLGASASVRTIGGLNYIQIMTNTYETNGSLRIKSSSTANSSFSFTTDVTNQSTSPNKAYLLSGNSGPFDFVENDSLVVVVNNDIVNSTYSVAMNYQAAVTTLVSTTAFRASTLSPVFPIGDQLVDYYVAFKNGPNTGTGLIDSVAIQGGGLARYTFVPVPGNFSIFAPGDLFKVTDLTDSENNGNFLIVNKGSDYVDVMNADAVVATAQNGSATLAQRRLINDYNQLNGQVVVSSAFNAAPAVGNIAFVIPSTVTNVVDYMNNTKITSLSLKAAIQGANNNTKVQISSNLEGSDGYVQVTGGNANKEFGFSTIVFRGLAAYSYWTGLLALVHKVIYGDDSNLGSYPGYGAAGITFRVLAPTIQNLEIELDITLAEGISISSLENDIKSAVTGYVNTLGVGDDVIIERIRAAVIGISGVIDVVINSPTANIAIADNEVAKVADPDVLIG
jgi:uncharacterized phage protein gp47/JayE